MRRDNFILLLVITIIVILNLVFRFCRATSCVVHKYDYYSRELADLKYGEKVRGIETVEANNDFRRAIRLRKQINKIHTSTRSCKHHKSTLAYRSWNIIPLCHYTADIQSQCQAQTLTTCMYY
jgi:hypothetical protein